MERKTSSPIHTSEGLRGAVHQQMHTRTHTAYHIQFGKWFSGPSSAKTPVSVFPKLNELLHDEVSSVIVSVFSLSVCLSSVCLEMLLLQEKWPIYHQTQWSPGVSPSTLCSRSEITTYGHVCFQKYRYSLLVNDHFWTKAAYKELSILGISWFHYREQSGRGLHRTFSFWK